MLLLATESWSGTDMAQPMVGHSEMVTLVESTNGLKPPGKRLEPVSS